LHALRALAACKFDEPEMRAYIVDNCLRLLGKSKSVKVNSKAARDGLVGLANSATVDDKVKELASRLAS
jgi:hypothetical protein